MRVGRCTELVSICNDNVTGRMRRWDEHRVWVWGRKDVCFSTHVIKLAAADPLDLNAQVLQLLLDDALRHAPDQILQ